MSERRTEIDIMIDILTAIDQNQGSIKHTHLVHKTNLTHQSLNLYIEKLEKKNLLLRQAAGKFFITDKGFGFLDEYRRMKSFLESIDL